MFGFFKKGSQGNGSEAPKTKKSKGYFLELDDTGNVKSQTEAKKPESTEAPAAKAEEPKAKNPEPVKAPAAPEQPPVAPAPTPAKAVSNGRVEPQPGLTFAPNNLLPLTTNNGRRRPGPSMNNFLEMARQMKK